MSTARITPIEAPYEPAIEEMFKRAMPAGMEPLKLFRTMARNPRVLQRMFAASLLDQGQIELRDREIVILRTCARCGSEYEWGIHVAVFSQGAGLSQNEIAASRVSESVSEIWSEREMSLIRVVDELHDTAQVSDAAWDALIRYFSVEQALELIMLVGYYHTISFLTNACRIELENAVPRFNSR